MWADEAGDAGGGAPFVWQRRAFHAGGAKGWEGCRRAWTEEARGSVLSKEGDTASRIPTAAKIGVAGVPEGKIA